MKLLSLKNMIAIGCVIACVIVITLGCKKESTECTAVITVKKLYDTMTIVPFARVIIAPDYPDVRKEGLSNASGQFTWVFEYEGILDVYASKKIDGTPDSLFGKGVVRLKPGETSYKTVFVN